MTGMIKVILTSITILAVILVSACASQNENDVQSTEWTRTPVPATATPILNTKSTTKTEEESMLGSLNPPDGSLNTEKDYGAIIETNKGNIVLELFVDDAPLTVENFINLSRSGFYNDNLFHRVIDNFMIQTGSGRDGNGVPYRIKDELNAKRRHDGPGVVSMANIGQPDTGGGQFFITHVATPHLDGFTPDGARKPCAAGSVSCHAVFGKVIEGQEVVNAIAQNDRIKTVRITEN